MIPARVFISKRFIRERCRPLLQLVPVAGAPIAQAAKRCIDEAVDEVVGSLVAILVEGPEASGLRKQMVEHAP